jgi:hypothetical protein
VSLLLLLLLLLCRGLTQNYAARIHAAASMWEEYAGAGEPPHVVSVASALWDIARLWMHERPLLEGPELSKPLLEAWVANYSAVVRYSKQQLPQVGSFTMRTGGVGRGWGWEAQGTAFSIFIGWHVCLLWACVCWDTSCGYRVIATEGPELSKPLLEGWVAKLSVVVRYSKQQLPQVSAERARRKRACARGVSALVRDGLAWFH